jgi:hypothetical protein
MSKLATIEEVINHSYPLSPIREDAFGTGYGAGFNDSDFTKKLQSYLSQPITLKK